MNCTGQEGWEILDNNNVYFDQDGSFDCLLKKTNDQHPMIVYRMQIIVVSGSNGYSLVLDQSDDNPTIVFSHGDIQPVKDQFYAMFHNLTGNHWIHRTHFVNVPGNFRYVPSSDLNSLSSSEEQQVAFNAIQKIPKFHGKERAFFNTRTKSIEKTHIYVNDCINYQIILPNIPPDKFLYSTLLILRPLVVRIGVLYAYKSTTQTYYGTGLLITNNLVLTCGHIFDPVNWNGNVVSPGKIFICRCDPTYDSFFSLISPNDSLIECHLVRRGLVAENVSSYDEMNSTTTDLALLKLNKPIINLSRQDYFDPKIHPLSNTSNRLPINSKLFVVAYNGELANEDDLYPYKYVKGFEDVTIEKLNSYHNVNYKSISIGNLIQNPSIDNQYAMHSCSTLAGSRGAVVLDSFGRLAGIHIGVANSKKDNNDKIVFDEETYNRYLPVNTNIFQQFIQETILPNIDDDELQQQWTSTHK